MLKERLKFILKDTALYGVANAFSRVVSFFTLPIIVRQISAAEFGVWNLLTILGTLVWAVVIFGMDSAVVRFYYDNNDNKYRKNIFSHGFFIQMFLSLFFCTAGFLFPAFWLKTINLGDSFKNSLYLIFLWIPANVFAQYFQNWFKWTFQRMYFLTLSVGTAGLNLILLFIFYKLDKMNLNYVLLLQAISVWIFALTGFWWCRNNYIMKIEWRLIFKLAAFGFPMMLVLVISILSPALDRIFLVNYLTEEQVGIYSLCQKLSIIMMVVVVAFQTAFGPFAFSVWKKNDAPQTFSRFHSYYIIAAGVIGILICSCGKPLILLIGTKEYLGTEKYLPFLTLGVIVYGLYSFASIGIFYSKKIKFNLLALTICISVNALFNFVFIPHYKEYGAAAGFLGGNAALVLSGYFFSRKLYRIDFSVLKDGSKMLLLSCGMFATNISFYPNLWIDVPLKVVILSGTFAFVSFLLLAANEKAFIINKIIHFIFGKMPSKNNTSSSAGH